MDIFISICFLLAGIAVFLLGIKLMSDGLEKGAGKSIKKMFARIGDNRFAGAGIGAGATATVQSSTAVTVMVVGFANAGVITLLQATAIIMGANVGTTLTAFFGAVANLPIAPFFMMSGIVGVCMLMFSKKEKIRIIGEIITGLSIIFVGMNLMSGAFPSGGRLRNAFQSVFVSMQGFAAGPLLLMLIGAVFTAVVQSSTAATNMSVIMAVEGVLPLEAGIFIILGANIGTTLTAIIASIGASSNARRAAMIHLVYNLIGVVVFLPVLWTLRTPIASFLTAISRGNYGFATAFFHLFYNILLFGLLIGFTRPLAKLVSKLVPAKSGEGDDEPQLYFLNDSFLTDLSTQANIDAAKELLIKEILHMAELARENLQTAFRQTLTPDLTAKNKIINTEQKINFVNKGIGRFLVKLSRAGLSKEDEKMLNSFHHVINNIERIGDHAMDFLDEAEDMKENKVIFTQPAVLDLEDMNRTLISMFTLALQIFETRDPSELENLGKLRRQIGDKKRELGFGHIKRLKEEKCNVEAGIHFYAIIESLERIRNNLANIAFSIRSTAGAQLEQLKLLSKEKSKKRYDKKKVYW